MNNSIEILLVEDSPSDIEFTTEALKMNNLNCNLHVTKDGIEALKFLRRIDGYQEAITPDIILLDLNLPKKDGREVLAEIKMDKQLRYIPVIVLSTSNAENDVLHCYENYANCFVIKPMDFEDFMHIAKIIEDFWFNIVKLPKQDD